MRRLKPAVAIGIFAVFVGCLVALVWLGYRFLNNYLNTSHTYGSVEVHFQGHSSQGFLSHRWDSIAVKGAGFDVVLQNPDLNAHLLLSPGEDFIRIQTEKARVEIDPEKLPQSDSSKMTVQIPDFRIPLNVQTRISLLQVSVKNMGNWSADSFEIQSLNEKEARLSFQNAQGDFILRKTSGTLDASWQGDFLSANVKIQTEDNDTLSLALHCPRNAPTRISGTADVQIQNPALLVPNRIPKQISIKNIRFHTAYNADIEKKKFSYNARIQTNLGALWPLPALALDLNLQSNEKMVFQFNGKLTGKKPGQIIALQGKVDKNLMGSADIKISGIESRFGPRFQPLNCTVHATKSSANSLKAVVKTESGSEVKADISGLAKNKKFNIDFTGDISPNEAWATRWSGKHLRLGSRPQVKGNFQNGTMRADVSIAPVEYAYNMTADSLFTTLVLNKNGIDFVNGHIRTPKEKFSFTGDVKWHDSIPHTSWEVHQSDSGFAKAFIDFDLDLKSEAHRVRLSTIPFADSSLLRGFDGIVTATFAQNFSDWNGNLDAEVETEILQIPLRGHFKIHNTIDSLSLDSAIISTKTNSILMEGLSLLHFDSAANFFDDMQIIEAWASTEKFDIPLLLEAYKGSPLSTGVFSGNVSFRKGSGIQGSLAFSDLALKDVDPEFFSISKLNVFAEKEKMQISGKVKAGNQAWNGDLQIDINGLLEPHRHLFAYFMTPVGGTAWLDGTLDSTYRWKGNAQVSGSWFLPQGMGEIVYTDFKADASGDLHSFIDSLRLSFHSDSTAIDTKRGFPILPVSFSGTFENGVFHIPTAKLTNNKGEFIQAEASYDLKNKKLQNVRLGTDKFSILWNQIHRIQLNSVRGTLEDDDREFKLALQLDSVTYKLNKPEWGEADALAHGNATLHLPHAENGSFANPTLEGNIRLDRAVYKNTFSVDLGFGSISKISATLSSFFTKIRRTKPPVKKTAAKSRPLNISVHISDSQRDTVAILTNLASFPLTVDLWILGNSDHPLFRGDINNSGNGSIGLKDLFRFNLESFAISFQDVPWKRGTINISSVQELPYCQTSNNRDDNETCPVHLDILGTLIAPKPMPSANCNTDDSPASLYYSVLLGCISEGENSSIDKNKVAGKLIGSVLSSTANKTLGGEYVGDIDMKLKFFDDEALSEKDSSYLTIPISLDRWVKDLSLIFGYKQDQSETPTYDRALEAGITYIIPAFSEADKTKNPEHYNPQLDFGASLVQKNYITTTTEDESRLEKNIGFNYSYTFWSPCFFGLGKCAENKEKK